MKTKLLVTLALLNIFLFCIAQDSLVTNTALPKAPWFVERFKLSAGIFLSTNSTNVMVGNTTGDFGTDINFENDLGFNKSASTFSGGFQWRLKRRSRLDFTYMHFNRNADYMLEKNITFGKDVYHINANVKSFFNTDIYRLSYGYAIVEKKQYEIGLMVGAHVINGNVGIGLNTNDGSLSLHNNFKFTAPLPDFGIWGGFSMGNRWAFNAEVNYLSGTVDQMSGRILGGAANITFRAIQGLDISAGFTSLNFKLAGVKDDLDGHLKWGYNGPSASVSYSFGHKYWR